MKLKHVNLFEEFLLENKLWSANEIENLTRTGSDAYIIRSFKKLWDFLDAHPEQNKCDASDYEKYDSIYQQNNLTKTQIASIKKLLLKNNKLLTDIANNFVKPGLPTEYNEENVYTILINDFDFAYYCAETLIQMNLFKTDISHILDEYRKNGDSISIRIELADVLKPYIKQIINRIMKTKRNYLNS